MEQEQGSVIKAGEADACEPSPTPFVVEFVFCVHIYVSFNVKICLIFAVNCMQNEVKIFWGKNVYYQHLGLCIAFAKSVILSDTQTCCYEGSLFFCVVFIDLFLLRDQTSPF